MSMHMSLFKSHHLGMGGRKKQAGFAQQVRNAFVAKSNGAFDSS